MKEPEVLGKYTLLRKLAAGGMAEVFLSRVAGPAGFEKTVVVKRILGHLAEDPSFIAMFLSEAKLAAQLNHPNVVQVFDFGEQEGTWFLVMELIDGLNLRHLFRKGAEKGEYLPIGLALKIATMALEGLAYAHEFADPVTGEPMGLVHRDVSPDNILVGRNGAVKVVDFGIAKAANQTHLTRTGTVKGKFAYMPPEQLQGQALDRRADVFAMGIVLYEMLTTRKPFDTANDAVVVRAILYEKFTPLRTYRPEAPEELERILDKAFAKDANERYADCRAMAHDLERLMLTAGLSATPWEIAQLVQRLGGPSTIAQVATPRPSPSIAANTPTATTPHPIQPVLQPATVPAEPTATPLPTGVASMPAAASTLSGATTPHPQVKVVDKLGPMEVLPTPAPRSGPPLPAAAAPPPPPPPTGVLPTPAPAPVPAVAPARPYEGSPSRPGVASPGGGAPSFEAIPPPQEWLGPGVGEQATTTPGWAQAPLQGHAPKKKQAIVIESAEPRRSSAVLWVSAGVAAIIGVVATWAWLSTRQPERVVVTLPAKVDQPPPPVVEPPKPPVVVEPTPPPPVVVEPTPPVEPEVVDAGAVVVAVNEPKKPPRRPKEPKTKVDLPPPPPPPAAGEELVDFRVRPFGTVSVDGKLVGDTPFPPVKLAPGSHKVQVVNRDLNKTVSRTFEVKAGGSNVFRLNLEEETN